jgi:hypothetical protein
MAKGLTPLTTGLVVGNVTGFINQGRNTAIDRSDNDIRDQQRLAAHNNLGRVRSSHVTAPKQPTRGVTGKRQGGGSARIRGGSF